MSKQIGMVIHAFEAEDDTQCTVNAGDSVFILDSGEGHWTEIMVDWSRKKGLIPTEYIEATDSFGPLPPTMLQEDARKLIGKFLKWALIRKRRKLYLSQFQDRSTRNNLIREVLSSEKAYCGYLGVFIDCFLKPLRENKLVDEQTIKKLFSNVEQIYKINLIFLTAIEDGMKRFPEQQSFGSSVKKIAPFFRTYTTYVNNYQTSIQCFNGLYSSNVKFQEFINALYKRKDVVQSQKFASLLIMPIQRLGRYRMLFEQILKYTPVEHVERDNIEDALKHVSEVAQFVNSNQKTLESQKVMVGIAGAVKERYLTLIQPHRSMKLEGSIKLGIADRKINFETFRAALFSDMVMLIEELNIKNFKKAQFFTIMLQYCEIGKSMNPRELSLICYNDRTRRFVNLVFWSEEERKEWESEIQESLDILKDFMARIGIDDPIKKAHERTSLRNQIEDSRVILVNMGLNFDKARAQTFECNKKIIEYERQLEDLQKQLALKKERKLKVDNDLLFQNEKFLYGKRTEEKSLENLLVQLVDRDQIYMESVRDDISSFKTVFGCIPTTNSTVESVLNSFPDPQVPTGLIDKLKSQKDEKLRKETARKSNPLPIPEITVRIDQTPPTPPIKSRSNTLCISETPSRKSMPSIPETTRTLPIPPPKTTESRELPQPPPRTLPTPPPRDKRISK